MTDSQHSGDVFSSAKEATNPLTGSMFFLDALENSEPAPKYDYDETGVVIKGTSDASRNSQPRSLMLVILQANCTLRMKPVRKLNCFLAILSLSTGEVGSPSLRPAMLWPTSLQLVVDTFNQLISLREPLKAIFCLSIQDKYRHYGATSFSVCNRLVQDVEKPRMQRTRTIRVQTMHFVVYIYMYPSHHTHRNAYLTRLAMASRIQFRCEGNIDSLVIDTAPRHISCKVMVRVHLANAEPSERSFPTAGNISLLAWSAKYTATALGRFTTYFGRPFTIHICHMVDLI